MNKMKKEIWKDINDYEGFYKVSNFGNVKSLDRINSIGNKLKGNTKSKSKNKHGYYSVPLSKNAEIKMFYVHRLVAIHFIDNPENKKTVNHKDGDKLNNYFKNLEWSTQQENVLHSIENGLTDFTSLKKKVFQFNRNNVFICEYNSLTEASKQNNIKLSSIIECTLKSTVTTNIRGKKYYSIRKTAGGYKWSLKNKINE